MIVLNALVTAAEPAMTAGHRGGEAPTSSSVMTLLWRQVRDIERINDSRFTQLKLPVFLFNASPCSKFPLPKRGQYPIKVHHQFAYTRLPMKYVYLHF